MKNCSRRKREHEVYGSWTFKTHRMVVGRFGYLMLVFGAILYGCVGQVSKTGPQQSASAPNVKFSFDMQEILLGSGRGQTVLTGFFLGRGMADVAVLDTDENDRRRLRIFATDGRDWAPVIESRLSSETLYVDVANIDGRDRIVAYEPDGLTWLDPQSAREGALVAVTSDYQPPLVGGVPHVDITRDLNGDGRDDLVVPHLHGFWLLTQLANGAFADPVKIGPTTGLERYYDGEGYRYDPWGQGRIHQIDYNHDGREDLVFWDGDHFKAYLQNEIGLFDSRFETFTTEVVFDSDDLASLAAPWGVRRRRLDHNPSGELEGRVLHSLSDQNGDGVADLVIFSLRGGSLWRMYATREIHFGAPTADGGTQFAAEVGAAIHSDGIPFGLRSHDLDRDGGVDVMFTTINPGVFKAIGMLVGALLTRSFSLDFEVYPMKEGAYAKKPAATRNIRAHSPGVSGEKSVHFPPLLIGDVNGDGHADLLMGKRQEMLVFLGVSGPGAFARRPQKIPMAIPNEEFAWLADLNKDGSQDILLHHSSTSGPGKLTLLIAR